MGLAEFLECDARLRPAKESFHILVVGQAEHGRAVALGVFVPGSRVNRVQVTRFKGHTLRV